MVTKTKVSESTIVFNDIFLELDNSWIVFEVVESLDKSSIEFDDLRKGKPFVCGFVKTSSGLNHLQCLVIRSIYGDCEKRMVNRIEKSFDGIASCCWITIFLDQFRWDSEWHAKFDDGAGSKLVGVEIIHSAWDDFQVGVGVSLEGTQRHYSHTSYSLASVRGTTRTLQRKEIWSIMTSALGINANASTFVNPLKHLFVHPTLIDFWRRLELRSTGGL